MTKMPFQAVPPVALEVQHQVEPTPVGRAIPAALPLAVARQELPLAARRELPLVARQELPLAAQQELPLAARQELPLVARQELPLVAQAAERGRPRS